MSTGKKSSVFWVFLCGGPRLAHSCRVWLIGRVCLESDCDWGNIVMDWRCLPWVQDGVPSSECIVGLLNLDLNCVAIGRPAFRRLLCWGLGILGLQREEGPSEDVILPKSRIQAPWMPLSCSLWSLLIVPRASSSRPSFLAKITSFTIRLSCLFSLLGWKPRESRNLVWPFVYITPTTRTLPSI